MKIKKFNKNKNYDEILRKLMIDIHDEIKIIDKLNYFIDFDKKYGVVINIQIKIKNIKTITVYHAQTSIMDIIKSEFKKIHIDIYIEDNKINQNKTYGIIAHELAHYYQLLFDEDNIYFKSFNQMINIENFKETVLNYKKSFLNYIYYNFQHELDARINQTYECYLYSNEKTFNDMLNNFYDDELYKILIYLSNYDSEKMISNFNTKKLINLTNQFNKLYNINEININQLSNYYKNWEIVFKKNSKDYIKKSLEALKQAFNKEKRYEKQITHCYDERPLYENYDYDMDEEIMKLVDQFKKIPL